MNVDIFLSFLCVSGVLILCLYLFRHEGTRLSSIKIFIYLNLVSVSFFLLIVCFDLDYINYLVLESLGYRRVGPVFVEFSVLYSVFILVVCIGYGVKKRVSLFEKKVLGFFEFSDFNYYSFGVVLFLFGLCGYFLFLDEIGGFLYLLENISKRASLTSGNGYLLATFRFFNIACMFLVYSYSLDRRKFKLLTLLFVVFITVIVYSTLGGRKPAMQLLITLLIVWNYVVFKVRLTNIKVVLLGIFLFVYFFMVPSLRSDNKLIEIDFGRYDILGTLVESVKENIGHISYVNSYVLVVGCSETDKLWLGASYLDLLYALMPRSVYKDKPPVDDGVYLRSIAAGYEVEPSMPYWRLFQGSWPLETFGASYMNFSIVGLFVFGGLLGYIYKTVYLYLKLSGFSLFSILLFSHVVLNFHFSNLRIVQLLVFFFTLYLVKIVSFLLVKDRVGGKSENIANT